MLLSVRSFRYDTIEDEMREVVDEKGALLERIKELNCLYEMLTLSGRHTLGPDGLLQEIVNLIPAAFQFPERICASISHDGLKYQTKDYSPRGESLKETIKSERRTRGYVEVAYRNYSDVCGVNFLEDEKKLLKAIAGLLGSIIEKKEAEINLKRTTEELRKQTLKLENKNIALREIVSQIGLEKKIIENQMKLNIELTVLPLLDRIQGEDLPPEAWRSYLKVMRQNLTDIASSFTRRVIEDRVRLSPRELEICNFIKNGLSNKEIAGHLQISPLTVERHRHNVRKKLKINNEKINLATFLRDL